jgi:hypothetical protein
LSELGFESKLKKLSFEEGPTFLKGWWVPSTSGGIFEYHWMPLPSQIIKLGKVGTDPSITFSQVDPAEAHRRMASAMALGYPIVDYDYPILGCFLKKMRGLTNAVVKPVRKQIYGVDMCGPVKTVDRDLAIALICKRYGLTESDIDELESRITDAPFPCVMVDDRFNNLVRADYG